MGLQVHRERRELLVSRNIHTRYRFAPLVISPVAHHVQTAAGRHNRLFGGVTVQVPWLLRKPWIALQHLDERVEAHHRLLVPGVRERIRYTLTTHVRVDHEVERDSGVTLFANVHLGPIRQAHIQNPRKVKTIYGSWLDPNRGLKSRY